MERLRFSEEEIFRLWETMGSHEVIRAARRALFMPDLFLKDRLQELCRSRSTLLWLEGSKYERVLSVRLSAQKLVLKLANSTIRVVAFDRYSCTSVGLQFWAKGRPGVLYRWEQVPVEKGVQGEEFTKVSVDEESLSPDDWPSPPNFAA